MIRQKVTAIIKSFGEQECTSYRCECHVKTKTMLSLPDVRGLLTRGSSSTLGFFRMDFFKIDFGSAADDGEAEAIGKSGFL